MLESSLKENKANLAQKKKIREQVESEIKEIEGRIKEKEKYEKEIEKTNVMLIGKKEQIKSLVLEKSSLEKQLQELQKIKFDELELSSLEIKEKLLEKEKKNKEKEQIEILSSIASFKSKILESEKLKSQISSLKMCPTCFQSVAPNYKENVLRKFEDEIILANKKLAELDKEKEKISSAKSSFDKELFDTEKKIEDFKFLKVRLESVDDKQKRLSSAEKQIVSIEKDIDLLNRQTDLLKNSAFELRKFENIFESKNKELKLAFDDERKYEISLAQIDKEIELTKTSIEKINKSILEKEKVKTELIYLSEFEDWLSKEFVSLVGFTEKNVMLKLREEFSKTFNDWFNVLVPDTFSTKLDEDFTPIIEQQDYSLDYSFLSGGERTAIALAYRLALNQVINSLLSKIKTRDIVILDEPTDGFSEQQLDKMRDVLGQLNVKQLIMVSHEQKIESFVENIIKFKKENGLTKVDYGK